MRCFCSQVQHKIYFYAENIENGNVSMNGTGVTVTHVTLGVHSPILSSLYYTSEEHILKDHFSVRIRLPRI